MPKAKPVPASEPPTKKRGARAAAARRSRTRRVTARRSNPAGEGAMVGTLKAVGAGAGAYGGTRLLQRLTWTLVAKRKPTWAKHAHAAAGALAFAAAWFLGRKVKQVAHYHDAILLGTGVAAVQGVVSAYVPRYAWLMNDCRPEDLRLPAAAAPQAQAGESDGYDLLEEQLSALEQGHAPRRQKRPVAAALQAAAAADGGPALDDALLEELGDAENIDDLYSGLFEDATLAN